VLKRYIDRLKEEFRNYNTRHFSKDMMAGITVAAVALPLALAFGVSSGADAAAGLITAVIAGFVISVLSGASFQISGPTGAMAAILISITAKYTIQGVFIVSILAGIILLLAGILKFGKLVNVIPRPVITGFTSGIAIIIALGQIDNFFGTTSSGDNIIQRMVFYVQHGFDADLQTVAIGAIVVLTMILWPKNLNARVPSSLVGLVAATAISIVFKFDVGTIGAIPRSLLPEIRFSFAAFNISSLPSFLSPALSVAALGMIESLLCGTSAMRMKQGESFDADQELVAQGIGNIIVPFFGGIPATAAIARTSVAIKSGSVTRLTGIIHALVLLASMFLLSDTMALIPYPALAGVLIVTAWRMNEWSAIRNIFRKHNKSAVLKFLITMTATVVFDLTVAILIGIVFSAFVFVMNSSKLKVTASRVRNELLHSNENDIEEGHEETTVIYITGPLFFGNAEKLNRQIQNEIKGAGKLIFSMRGVPVIDTTGIEVMMDIVRECSAKNITVNLCGLNEDVQKRLDLAGISDIIGENAHFFSVDRALLTARVPKGE
jgi:SulP family sulfate permease